MDTHLPHVAPSNENRQVEPILRRGTNAEARSREYLTAAEVEKLIKAAKAGRWGHRDATLILVAFRHGLRAKEACELEWSQVEFCRSAALHVRRAKNGKPSDADIDAAMNGNVCRCGTYLRIRQAVHRAAAIAGGKKTTTPSASAKGETTVAAR